MSVQINNGKVPEEFNGLDPMITELLQFSDTDRVTAVVTYKVTKKTQNIETGDDYPVVRAVHIEPLRDGDSIEAALRLQRMAKESRTGTTVLDGVDEVLDEPMWPEGDIDADDEIDDESPLDEQEDDE